MFSATNTNHTRSSLYTKDGRPKYLNQTERQRFIACAKRHEQAVRLLCLTLVYSGCRLTEALNLSSDSILEPEQALLIHSLKKRTAICYRQVPVPAELISELSVFANAQPGRLFIWGRTRALHHVKRVMNMADIDGIRGTARGLRHTFGTHGIHCDIPITLLQRWYGHAKLETTAIYTQVLGQEEREIAERMWR